MGDTCFERGNVSIPVLDGFSILNKESIQCRFSIGVSLDNPWYFWRILICWPDRSDICGSEHVSSAKIFKIFKKIF